MQVPQITKITVNMGVGEAVADKKVMDAAVGRPHQDHRPEAAGHASRASRSRRSSCARACAIGCKVTLRGARMYEFLDRLITIAMPRIRDFRGVTPRSFDGRGNYSLGVKEQIIFPEIEYDQIDPIRGMDITITTTASDNKQGGAARSLQLPVPQVRNHRRMAKTSMVEREKRRAKIVKKYAAKRAQLKEIIRSPKTSPEARADAQAKLQKLPRDASPSAPVATAARSPAARAACTASSAWRASSCAKRRCAANSRASQGQLVRSTWHEHDGSDRRPPDPHPQRRSSRARPKCRVSSSKLKLALVKVLKDEGYIADFPSPTTAASRR